MANMIPRWDEISPEEAKEREVQGKTNLAVTEYLAKPQPRKVNILDHGPWDAKDTRCLSCNRTQVELYSTPLMPPCQY